jgi:putative addiction module killer protein
MRGGNFANSEPVGEGVSENNIDFGPGFRIYYGTDGESIVLLGGGDKSTQKANIRNAKAHWKNYKRRQRVQMAPIGKGAKDKK